MSTADVARDLDLLRRAVGDQRLSYLGFSYGSYIGNTYANLFPRQIRALVIDGVLDPRLWSGGLQIVSDRVATAEEFAEFLRLCAEAPDDCALAATGNAAARYEALATALLETPLVLPGSVTYSYDFLVADTASAMYAPEFWGGEAGFAALFASLADAAPGVSGASQRARDIRRAIHARLQQAAPRREESYDRFLDTFYGNHCADAEYRARFPLIARSASSPNAARSSVPSGGGISAPAQIGRSRKTATPGPGRLAPRHRCWSSATSSMASRIKTAPWRAAAC